MTFLIAVVILIVLSVFSMGLRAYLSFCALLVGGAMTLMGLFGEKVMLYIGLMLLAYAFLAAYFTVRTSPKPMLRLQILRFFGYGMFTFLRVLMIMLIILIPLAGFFGQFARSYRDVMIMDMNGNIIGRTVVDDRNRDLEGRQYSDPDDPY